MKLNIIRRPKKKMIGTRFTEEEYAMLKRLRKSLKVSMAEVVGAIVREYLNKLK